MDVSLSEKTTTVIGKKLSLIQKIDWLESLSIIEMITEALFWETKWGHLWYKIGKIQFEFNQDWSGVAMCVGCLCVCKFSDVNCVHIKPQLRMCVLDKPHIFDEIT